MERGVYDADGVGEIFFFFFGAESPIAIASLRLAAALLALFFQLIFFGSPTTGSCFLSSFLSSGLLWPADAEFFFFLFLLLFLFWGAPC